VRLLLVEIAPADQRDVKLTTGLGYMAAYVRKRISEVEVRIIKGDPAWLERIIDVFNPDVVGLSTISQYYDLAVQAAHVSRSRGVFVVIGGHHVSSLPNLMTADMNLGVVGEGEDTMLEICRVFLDHGPDQTAFRDVPGVVLRSDSGEVYRAQPRPLHKPLDDFPFPARDLMHIRPGESVGIMTSRGCSYRCVFCASSAFWNGIRFHSAEYVVAETKEVVERYHVPHIYFWDDLFVADFKRVEKIVTLLDREPSLKKMKYSVTCRANLATDELARLLKEMNVVEAMFGFESMSPNTLQYLKPHVTVEDNRRAVDVFHRHGINVTGFFFIWSPRETPEEVQQTLDFVRTAPLYRSEAYMLTPLPGTPVWDYAVNRGLIDPKQLDWERLYIDNPENPENGVLLSETMSLEELHKYLSEFQRIRRRKDGVNLLRRVPQHLANLARSPLDELAIVVERLRTHHRGHI